MLMSYFSSLEDAESDFADAVFSVTYNTVVTPLPRQNQVPGGGLGAGGEGRVLRSFLQ